MSGPRKTFHDRIAEDQKRQEESRAVIADLQARARLEDRKLDTRRKIVAGGTALAHAKLSATFRDEFGKAMQARVTRPGDRAVFPEFFPEDQAAAESPTRPPEKPGDPPSGAAPA